ADITAAVICGLLIDVASNGGGWLAEQFARASGAGYGGPIFGVALFLSLVATGSYSRHRSLNAKARLLAGSSLACGLVLWRLVSGNLFVAAAVYSLTSIVTWMIVLGVRTVAEKFLSTVWPGTRGAAPALLITDRREPSLQLERAVLAAGGDYSLAGYVSIGRRRRARIDSSRSGFPADCACGQIRFTGSDLLHSGSRWTWRATLPNAQVPHDARRRRCREAQALASQSHWRFAAVQDPRRSTR